MDTEIFNLLRLEKVISEDSQDTPYIQTKNFIKSTQQSLLNLENKISQNELLLQEKEDILALVQQKIQEIDSTEIIEVDEIAIDYLRLQNQKLVRENGSLKSQNEDLKSVEEASLQSNQEEITLFQKQIYNLQHELSACIVREEESKLKLDEYQKAQEQKINNNKQQESQIKKLKEQLKEQKKFESQNKLTQKELEEYRLQIKDSEAQNKILESQNEKLVNQNKTLSADIKKVQQQQQQRKIQDDLETILLKEQLEIQLKQSAQLQSDLEKDSKALQNHYDAKQLELIRQGDELELVINQLQGQFKYEREFHLQQLDSAQLINQSMRESIVLKDSKIQQLEVLIPEVELKYLNAVTELQLLEQAQTEIQQTNLKQVSNNIKYKIALFFLGAVIITLKLQK